MRLGLAVAVAALALACGGADPETMPRASDAQIAAAVGSPGSFRCVGTVAEVVTVDGWAVVKDCATRPHPAGVPLACWECGAAVPTCAASAADALPCGL